MKAAKFCSIALALTLGACATHAPLDPKVEVKPFDIVVAAPCSPDLGPEPVYPDTDAALAAASDFDYVKLLVAGRLMRIARLAQQSSALAACATAPHAP